MRERIIRILHHYNITQTTFAERIGVSKGAVSHVLSQSDKSRKGDFKPDTIERIVNAFPEINKAWLLTGEGEMIEQSKVVGPQQSQIDFSEALGRRNTYTATANTSHENKDTNKLIDTSHHESNHDNNSSCNKVAANSLQNATHDDDIRDSGKEILNGILGSHSIKKVSRIVIFYDDGSFNQYTPNNDNY